MESSNFQNPNRLLAALSAEDLARLQPHLTAVDLKLLQKLERPNKPIEDIYFMHAGIASVVAVQPNGTSIEIGLIGREGMTGSSVLLGDDRSPALDLYPGGWLGRTDYLALSFARRHRKAKVWSVCCSNTSSRLWCKRRIPRSPMRAPSCLNAWLDGY